MELYMYVIATVLVLMQSVLCIALGFLIAQKGRVEIPNPIQAIKEHKAHKESEEEWKEEMDKVNTILRNIENYDGTSIGQEDVPWG
jgi:hypothetical protein